MPNNYILKFDLNNIYKFTSKIKDTSHLASRLEDLFPEYKRNFIEKGTNEQIKILKDLSWSNSKFRLTFWLTNILLFSVYLFSLLLAFNIFENPNQTWGIILILTSVLILITLFTLALSRYILSQTFSYIWFERNKKHVLNLTLKTNNVLFYLITRSNVNAMNIKVLNYSKQVGHRFQLGYQIKKGLKKKTSLYEFLLLYIFYINNNNIIIENDENLWNIDGWLKKEQWDKLRAEPKQNS